MQHILGFHEGEYTDGEVSGLSAVFGMRKMGKTTEVIRLAKQCRGTVVFWDYTGNHQIPLAESVTAYQPGQLKHFLLNRGKRKRGRKIIRYQPVDRTFVDHFRALCAICLAVGDMVIIADEMDACCGSRWGETRMPPELYEIAHMGRHHRLAMIATARDTPSVSKNYRSQCDTLRVFRVTEQDHIDYLAKRMGAKNAALLPYLPDYHYLLWKSGEPGVKLMTGKKEVGGIEHVQARAKNSELL